MGDACRDLRRNDTVRRSFTMVAMGEKYSSTYITYRTQFKMESRRSTTRMSHRSLNYDLGLDNYFTDAFTVERIRNFFVARGEILPLSYIPTVTASDTVCPICNMREQENVVHFIGRCPILREFRLLHFGKAQLQPQDVFNSLDGQCWSTLYSYINQALKYRNNILTESF